MQDVAAFSVRYQRGALVKYIWTGLLMVPVMGWFAWDSWNRPIKAIVNFVGIYLGAPMTLLFIVLIIGAIQLLLSKQPALEISVEGISYKPIIGGSKRVFWSEVGGFTIVDQAAGRGMTQTFIQVSAKSSPSRSLLSIPIKDLAMPDNDNLLLPVDYVTDALRKFASHHMETNDISLTDKRVAPSPHPKGIEAVGAWAVGVAITLILSVGSRFACQQANTVVVQQQQKSFIDTEMKRLDDLLEATAMYKAIKQVDPVEHERFRQMVREKMTMGGTQRDLDAMSGQFGNQFMQKRLKQATPAILEQYLQFRVELYEKVYKTSPEALYQIIMTRNFALDDMPESVQLSLQHDFQQLSDNVAGIIVAPLSDTPLPQSEALIMNRMRELYPRLTSEEQEAFRKEGKPDVDKKVYCQAILHLYREVLSLPENESIQVFRYLNVLPADDRLSP